MKVLTIIERMRKLQVVLIETSRGKGPLTLGQPANLTRSQGANSCGQRVVAARKMSAVVSHRALSGVPRIARIFLLSRWSRSVSPFMAYFLLTLGRTT